MTFPTAPLLTTFGGLIGASTVIVVEHGLQATQDVARATYTATEILMFITAVGSQALLIIAAIYTGWTAMTAKRIAAATQTETIAQTIKLDTVAKETAVVLGHVNSEKTADAKTIEFQARENQILRDQIAEKDRVAGLFAQSVATRAPVTGAAAPVVAAVIKDLHSVHEQIETNTRETAEAVKNLEPKPGPDKR